MSTTTKALTIEPAQPADETAVRRLLQAADLPHEDFAAHLPHFLVARQNGTVVGAVGLELHGRDALLRSLVVATAWRGEGLGGAFLRRIEDKALRLGVQHFYLLTTTAEKFFARHGFKEIPRELVPPAVAATREFQSLCPASAVCLMRPVKP